MAVTRSLKSRGRSGPTFGSWMAIGHPAVAEILAKAGFEWLVVDLEHSAMSLSQAEDLIRTVSLSGVAPLVRVSANDPVQIKRVMDAGSHGIIVPMVNSRADAEKAVQAVHYPPRGTRGVGLGRAQAYGTGFDEYRRWLADESVVIVQIEHIDAVRNIDAILAVEGVDGFIVGPYDLSASLGVPGQFEHPKVAEALAQVKARCPGRLGGFHVVQPDPAQVRARVAEGFTLIAYSVDFLLLGEAARGGLKQISDLKKKEAA